jgi:hypothetical protein
MGLPSVRPICFLLLRRLGRRTATVLVAAKDYQEKDERERSLSDKDA